MKPWIVKLLLASLLATLSALSAGSAAFAAPSQPHRPASDIIASGGTHVVTASNTYHWMTDLTGFPSNLVEDPSSFVYVMDNLTPRWYEGDPTYVPADPHPIGVMFNTAEGHWNIFNEDGADMPLGATFNVLFLSGDPTVDTSSFGYGIHFLQQATSANISGSSTIISDPQFDGEPDAILMVTANLAPSWVVDAHPLGVWYNSATGHWAILHEDGTPIPLGATYNVQIMIPVPGYCCYIRYTATPTTIGPNYTFIPSPNGPADLAFVTPVQPTLCSFNKLVGKICSPGGLFDTSPLALGYPNGPPTIFNTDGATMSTGTSFFVI